jgi:FKBP-type peptidyl-prolyl cis-trans isomerase 2
MAQAEHGDTVKVHYTGSLDDGSVFDSSEGREPLEFTLGNGDVIPGFDEGVCGMVTGEEKTVTIPAAQAYGDPRAELTAKVPREEFPDEITPEPGMSLQMMLPNGQPIPVTIVEVAEDHVLLDANHPLAGKDLTFKLQLVDVTKTA